MLLFVYLSYVLRSPAIAQQLSCQQATLQSSQSPGVSNIVFDTEPAFVYEDTDCRSTDQKIVGLDALSPDVCGPAIYAICGATNVTQQWTWAWSSSSTGDTCQAGLYQDGISGLLDSECCLRNFFAMRDAPAGLNTSGNRLSVNINIALRGFPFSLIGEDNNIIPNNQDGIQIAGEYPTYILQAYVVSLKSKPCVSICLLTLISVQRSRTVSFFLAKLLTVFDRAYESTSRGSLTYGS